MSIENTMTRRAAVLMALALATCSVTACSPAVDDVEVKPGIGSAVSEKAGDSGTLDKLTTVSGATAIVVDDAAAAALGYTDLATFLEADAQLGLGCDSIEKEGDRVLLLYGDASYGDALDAVEDSVGNMEAAFADANPGCALEVSADYTSIVVTAEDDMPDETSTEAMVESLAETCAFGQLLSHPGDPSVSMTYVAADGSETALY